MDWTLQEIMKLKKEDIKKLNTEDLREIQMVISARKEYLKQCQKWTSSK